LPAVDTASLPDVSIKTSNAEFKTSDLVGTRVEDERINGMMQQQMTYEDDYEDNVSRDSLMSRLIEEDGESDMRLIEENGESENEIDVYKSMSLVNLNGSTDVSVPKANRNQ
jgi:hypothetical protein